jgi:protein O-GlcNAc transferase
MAGRNDPMMRRATRSYLGATDVRVVATHKDRRRHDEAKGARGAFASDPAANAELGRGRALADEGRLGEAVQRFRRALAIKPDFAEAHYHLANALWNQGHIAPALGRYRRAIALDPSHEAARSNLAFALNYDPQASPSETYAAHLAWAALFPPPQAKSHANSREPDRRLRIGYVSGDLCTHAVSSFFEPLLASHDRAAFEVFCYSSLAARQEDDTTARLRSHADHWVRISSHSDESVAARIEKDRIDILVDLGGYTMQSRVKVFAVKPAPVQVTWLGYLNTTGLASMDYRVTDATVDPAGADRFNSEALVRIPAPCLCYRPCDLAPPVAEPPALAAGHVTFGSFNNLPKLAPDVIRTWAKVLHAVEGSHLVIKTVQMRDAATADDLRRRLAAEGIGPERVELLAWRVRTEHHLARYGLIDIVLDTFPFNGVTTTCEALWMGVPVVTLRGDRPYGRVGASLLTALDLGRFIADNPDKYVKISVGLARNVGRLKTLRASLRERMRASSLCDGATFARHLEQAYRAMWQDWCDQPGRPLPGSGGVPVRYA